jgi:hypothetical protein
MSDIDMTPGEVSMKLVLVATMATAVTYAVNVWPTATQYVQTLDTRPEAILTGTALLVLAALLRRHRV